VGEAHAFLMMCKDLSSSQTLPLEAMLEAVHHDLSIQLARSGNGLPMWFW